MSSVEIQTLSTGQLRAGPPSPYGPQAGTSQRQSWLDKAKFGHLLSGVQPLGILGMFTLPLS